MAAPCTRFSRAGPARNSFLLTHVCHLLDKVILVFCLRGVLLAARPRAGVLRRQGDLLVTTIPLSRRLLSAMQFQPLPNDLSRNRLP